MRRVLGKIAGLLSSRNMVGVDKAGNKYFSRKEEVDGIIKEKRWVIFKGEEDPTLIPVEWICWLNGQRKRAPTPEEMMELEARRERVRQNVAILKKEEEERRIKQGITGKRVSTGKVASPDLKSFMRQFPAAPEGSGVEESPGAMGGLRNSQEDIDEIAEIASENFSLNQCFVGKSAPSSMERRKRREVTPETEASTVDTPPQAQISASEALTVTLFCISGLGLALFVSNSGFDLVVDPSRTLFYIWFMELPVVLLLFSRYRQQCTYQRAVKRGMLALPLGALVNYLGAIPLGAPVTFWLLPKTVNWSLMMSLFTVVLASCVFGSSWAYWRRIFAMTKPNGSVEYLICLPAHGAVIGGWFGAVPMPLDWERPWQEWPISVSYGAIAGYLLGLVTSCVFVFAHGRSHHLKRN